MMTFALERDASLREESDNLPRVGPRLGRRKAIATQARPGAGPRYVTARSKLHDERVLRPIGLTDRGRGGTSGTIS